MEFINVITAVVYWVPTLVTCVLLFDIALMPIIPMHYHLPIENVVRPNVARPTRTILHKHQVTTIFKIIFLHILNVDG